MLFSSSSLYPERWRRHYNTVRPHSSLGNMPPAACKETAAAGQNRSATLK
ncbi:integrase core domain-containing protein [Megalodesulfovibrio gigas]